MDRIDKAIKYMNKHKAKALWLESDEIITAQVISGGKVHGVTHNFIRILNDRFPAGFTVLEIIQILDNLDDQLTQKQKDYYEWV